jgi:hypothetical protein
MNDGLRIGGEYGALDRFQGFSESVAERGFI